MTTTPTPTHGPNTSTGVAGVIHDPHGIRVCFHEDEDHIEDWIEQTQAALPLSCAATALVHPTPGLTPGPARALFLDVDHDAVLLLAHDDETLDAMRAAWLTSKGHRCD